MALSMKKESLLSILFRNNTSIKIVVTLFYSLIGIFLYFRTINIIFLSDDYNFLFRFEQLGIGAFLNNCNDSFFIPLSHFLTFVEYKIFGLNSIGYHLISLALHIANSILLFLVVRKIRIDKINANTGKMIAFFCGLLFLLNPYQTEAVNWLTAKSYLLSLFFMLLSLLFYFEYRQLQKYRLLIFSLVFFMLSLLSKEISIVFPLLILCFGYCNVERNKSSKIKLFANIIKVVGIYLIVLLVYFFLRFAVIGEIVGGYGREIHANFDLKLLSYNCIAYIAKFFLFYRFIPEVLIEFVKFNYILIILFLFVLMLILYFSIFKQLLKKRFFEGVSLRFGIILLFCFFISLIPVINLETSFLGEIQSDRYGYFTSVFYSILISYLIFLTLPNKFSNVILIIIALVFSYFTLQQNNVWNKAGLIAQNTINSILALKIKSKNVFVLNAPDSYKGAYIFRCGLNDAINLTHLVKKNKINIIAYQAIANISDNAKINLGDTIQVISTNKNYFLHSKNEKLPDIITFFERKREIYKFNISMSSISDINNMFIYCDANGICHYLF